MKYYYTNSTTAMGIKDSDRSHIHLTVARSAVLFDDWMKTKLSFDDILVPSEHQPISPEDDDDVIPDQYATFGITKNQQKLKEPAWKDLALNELLNNAPPKDELERMKHIPLPRFNKVTTETKFSSPMQGNGEITKELRRSASSTSRLRS